MEERKERRGSWGKVSTRSLLLVLLLTIERVGCTERTEGGNQPLEPIRINQPSPGLEECSLSQLSWNLTRYPSGGPFNVSVVREGDGEVIKRFGTQPEGTFSLTWYPVELEGGEEVRISVEEILGYGLEERNVVVGRGIGERLRVAGEGDGLEGCFKDTNTNSLSLPTTVGNSSSTSTSTSTSIRNQTTSITTLRTTTTSSSPSPSDSNPSSEGCKSKVPKLFKSLSITFSILLLLLE